MGLMKAASAAAKGVLGDQWKEYFYCDAMEDDVLMVKGALRRSGRSANTNGSDNVISNGSAVAVADGQCMMIVDDGRIAEFCAEPGIYIYDTSTEPSIFTGNLGRSILDSFKTFGRRFSFGGDVAHDQRVYYVNTRELMGNKYGTPSPVPFRVVDTNIGLDTDISIRCFGEYSYRICDPMLFYKHVAGNVTTRFKRENIEGQLKTELLTALGPAFGRISAMGVRYSALPGHTMEIAQALNEVLSAQWRQKRGLEIVNFGISSVKASEEDEAMMKELQRTAVFRNPGMAGAFMVGAQAEAMKTAAGNENGAMMGFLGMNMAQQAGGLNAGQLFQMDQASRPQPSAEGWVCACGAAVQGNFCPQCGRKKPEKTGWVCPSCGCAATGNFCPECGQKKPEDRGWVCACGTRNQGKFCVHCGARKPQGVPQYRCDKCGWQPEDPTKAPRFCPECGDPFDNGDIV